MNNVSLKVPDLSAPWAQAGSAVGDKVFVGVSASGVSQDSPAKKRGSPPGSSPAAPLSTPCSLSPLSLAKGLPYGPLAFSWVLAHAEFLLLLRLPLTTSPAQGHGPSPPTGQVLA